MSSLLLFAVYMPAIFESMSFILCFSIDKEMCSVLKLICIAMVVSATAGAIDRQKRDVVDLGSPVPIPWQYQNNLGLRSTGESIPRYDILKVNYDQYVNGRDNPDDQLDLQRSINGYYTTKQDTNPIPQEQEARNIYLEGYSPNYPGSSNLQQEQLELSRYQIYQNSDGSIIRPLIQSNQLASQPSAGTVQEPILNQEIKPVQEEASEPQNTRPFIPEGLVNRKQLPIDVLNLLPKLVDLERSNQQSNAQGLGLGLQDVGSSSSERRGNYNQNLINKGSSLRSNNAFTSQIRTNNIRQEDGELNSSQNSEKIVSNLRPLSTLRIVNEPSIGVQRINEEQNRNLYRTIQQERNVEADYNREINNQNSQKTLQTLHSLSALSGRVGEPSIQVLRERNNQQPISEGNGGLQGKLIRNNFPKQILVSSNQNRESSRNLASLTNQDQPQQDRDQRQRTQYGYSELSAKILNIMKSNPSMSIENLTQELQNGSGNPQIRQLKNILQGAGKYSGNLKNSGLEQGPQNNFLRSLIELVNKNGLNWNGQNLNGRWRY